MTIDIGSGDSWAYRHGVDEAYGRLMRHMVKVVTAEFLVSVQLLETALPPGTLLERLKHEFALFKALPMTAIRHVVSHPVWIYWARSVQHYYTALQDGTPVAPFWRGHLDEHLASPPQCLEGAALQFSQLVLAGHALAGRAVELPLNAGVQGDSLSLAGTGLVVPCVPTPQSGSQLLRGQVASTEEGLLVLRISGEGGSIELTCRRHDTFLEPLSADDYALKAVRAGSQRIEFDNRDLRFVKNWVSTAIHPQAASIAVATDTTLPGWCTHTHQALELLGQCAAPLHEEVGTLVRVIVPVSFPGAEERGASCSAREYWGAIQCSFHPGITMAEVLAHEYRHNLLNAIIEVDPVIEPDDAGLHLYSPWRLDPRPPSGLLHAIYAFTEVAAFHASYLEHFGDEAPQAGLARMQLFSNLARLEEATETLLRNVRLTPFGTGLLRGTAQRLADLAQTHRLPPGELAETIQGTLQRHHEAWQARNSGRTADSVGATVPKSFLQQ